MEEAIGFFLKQLLQHPLRNGGVEGSSKKKIEQKLLSSKILRI